MGPPGPSEEVDIIASALIKAGSNIIFMFNTSAVNGSKYRLSGELTSTEEFEASHSGDSVRHSMLAWLFRP